VPALGTLLHPQPSCLRSTRPADRFSGRAARQRHLLDCAGLPVGHPAQDGSHAHAYIGCHLTDGLGRERPPQTRCRPPFPRSHASHRDRSSADRQGTRIKRSTFWIRLVPYGPVGRKSPEHPAPSGALWCRCSQNFQKGANFSNRETVERVRAVADDDRSPTRDRGPTTTPCMWRGSVTRLDAAR
jgi:hypothetical protein